MTENVQRVAGYSVHSVLGSYLYTYVEYTYYILGTYRGFVVRILAGLLACFSRMFFLLFLFNKFFFLLALMCLRFRPSPATDPCFAPMPCVRVCLLQCVTCMWGVSTRDV